MSKDIKRKPKFKSDNVLNIDTQPSIYIGHTANEPPMNVRTSGAKKQSKDRDTVDLLFNGGTKYDQEKLPFDLIPIEPLNQLAKVLAFGAQKYDRFNWTKGFKYSRVYAATLRHLFAWYAGEDNDPEGSECSHLAHAMCNLVFLLEFIKTHPELDDRPFKTK